MAETIISPGVFTRENDLSFLPQGIGAIGAGYTANAAATFSAAIGYNAKTATGSNSTALTNSYASGADSFAAAIANNTSSYGATGANSIAMGYQNIANDPNAVAIGKSNISSGSQTSIAIGQSNNVTGMRGVAIGSDNTVSGLIGHAMEQTTQLAVSMPLPLTETMMQLQTILLFLVTMLILTV